MGETGPVHYHYGKEYRDAPPGYFALYDLAILIRDCGEINEDIRRNFVISGSNIQQSLGTLAVAFRRQGETWEGEWGRYEHWTGNIAYYFSPKMCKALVSYLMMHRRGLSETQKQAWLKAISEKIDAVDKKK